MTENVGAAAALDNATAYRHNIDPLLLYESQVTSGQEFRAYVPQKDEQRERASRHEKTLLKTWRGVPTESSKQNLRQGLSSMRDLESRHVQNSERSFAVVFPLLLLLLGLIVAGIALNLHL